MANIYSKSSVLSWHRRFIQQSRWTEELRQYACRRIGLQSGIHILEVGCGTGAVLETIKQSVADHNWRITGLDIQEEFLIFAQKSNPELNFIQGDAHHQPFSSNCFDLVYCHFLLLWVQKPVLVLQEMRRVLKPGGWVLAFAEPDYGGRIDEPTELAELGTLQEASLIHQGADTHMGRKLKSLFYQAGFSEIECGVLGAQWRLPSDSVHSEFEEEWRILELDLQEYLSAEKTEEFHRIELAARLSGKRLVFVPTFYAMGRAKEQ